MGLDAVELVLAFEEEFGIAIPDAAAEKMRTPRDVIDFVLQERQRVAQLDAMKHLSEALAGMGFANVRPEMSFRELFGNQRIARWKELGKRLAPFSIPRDVPHGPGGAVSGWSFLGGVIALFMSQWRVLVRFCSRWDGFGQTARAAFLTAWTRWKSLPRISLAHSQSLRSLRRYKPSWLSSWD